MLTSSVFNHNQSSVRNAMLKVCFAALPAIATHVYFFGFGIIIQLVLAISAALLAETIMLKLRQRPVKFFITDGSAVVAAVIMAFCVPPYAPWWIVVSGSMFAMVFGKHLYGGLGYNPFNPIMVGFCFLIISFPVQMTVWASSYDILGYTTNFTDAVAYIFSAHNAAQGLDQITGATPLDEARIYLANNVRFNDILQIDLFNAKLAANQGWMALNLAFLIGGLWMLWTRTIRWQYPVGFLAALTLMAFGFHQYNPEQYGPISFHLLSGGTMMAAFFIITEPVSGSATPLGRFIFAASIGILTYITRNWGAFPDGIAFAVLIMNMFVPLIDQFTQPRVFGHTS